MVTKGHGQDLHGVHGVQDAATSVQPVQPQRRASAPEGVSRLPARIKRPERGVARTLEKKTLRSSRALELLVTVRCPAPARVVLQAAVKGEALLIRRGRGKGASAPLHPSRKVGA